MGAEGEPSGALISPSKSVATRADVWLVWLCGQGHGRLLAVRSSTGLAAQCPAAEPATRVDIHEAQTLVVSSAAPPAMPAPTQPVGLSSAAAPQTNMLTLLCRLVLLRLNLYSPSLLCPFAEPGGPEPP
jgi:hypothetical protein